MILGLNHLTLSVQEVERSFHFYRSVLGFRPLARWSRGAYLLAGDAWVCLTLDARTREAPLPEYTHIAFSVPVAAFDAMATRIRASGATEWQPNTSEGASLYFCDPDGHKLEIHVGDWRTRLAACRERPFEDSMVFFEDDSTGPAPPA
ncbi:MAG: fosfomycin resistance glutathione transferase [Polyangiaceae bacterium]|jgi:catechol 2,3-dioxygenase-like lactoylglutathione lyase family enzyme|nr:fosfomycin resistance glutathione transferase [Polyangiaceae bacterium]